ncbi:MAG: hypothetical protein AABY22_27475 [Nanoarchaeota archaeon]
MIDKKEIIDFVKNYKVDNTNLIKSKLENLKFCRAMVFMIQEFWEYNSTTIMNIARGTDINYGTARDICNFMYSVGWIELPKERGAILISPVRNSKELVIEKYIDKAIETIKKWEKFKK